MVFIKKYFCPVWRVIFNNVKLRHIGGGRGIVGILKSSEKPVFLEVVVIQFSVLEKSYIYVLNLHVV